MIELLAKSGEDGWAVVRMEEKLRLLRPPYSETRCPWIDDVDMTRLLAEGDFAQTVPSIPFQTWMEVVDHLQKCMVAAAVPMQSEQVQESALKLLLKAPVEKIEHFLHRIENELLPAKHFLAAQSILLAMT